MHLGIHQHLVCEKQMCQERKKCTLNRRKSTRENINHHMKKKKRAVLDLDMREQRRGERKRIETTSNNKNLTELVTCIMYV